nr:MAG TPA: hypothetical protein [Caudoviricetes sp.]
MFLGLAIWDQAMESPGTVAILFLHYFGCLWKEPSLNRDGFLKKRRLCFF